MNNGFIYIASVSKLFYKMAAHSAESLRDFYPDANITLFTHEKFLDNKQNLFNNVVTNIPIHTRAKMWGMARSPYDRTLYIDSDTEIWSDEIKNVHLVLDQCDLFFSHTPIYSAGNIKWIYVDKEHSKRLELQGGVCGFKKSELTIDFLQTWYDEYCKQQAFPWPYLEYHPELKPWDMFTLWKLTNEPYYKEKYKSLVIKKESVKYNYCINYLPSELKPGESPVIIQYIKDQIKNHPNLNKQINYENEKTYFTKQEVNQYPPRYN